MLLGTYKPVVSTDYMFGLYKIYIYVWFILPWCNWTHIKWEQFKYCRKWKWNGCACVCMCVWVSGRQVAVVPFEWHSRKMGDTILTCCHCARRCAYPNPDVPHPTSLKSDYSQNPFINFPPDLLYPPPPSHPPQPPPPLPRTLVFVIPSHRPPLLRHPRAIVATGTRSPRGTDGGPDIHSAESNSVQRGWTKTKGMEDRKEVKITLSEEVWSF